MCFPRVHNSRLNRFLRYSGRIRPAFPVFHKRKIEAQCCDLLLSECFCKGYHEGMVHICTGAMCKRHHRNGLLRQKVGGSYTTDGVAYMKGEGHEVKGRELMAP